MYTTRTRVTEVIEESILEKVLSRGSGTDADVVFTAMLAVAESEIDGYIGTRYVLPLGSVPALVAHAAVVLFCELAYKRCGIPAEQNPWMDTAREVRGRLQRVADGAEGLPGMESSIIAASVRWPDLKFAT